MKVIKPEWYLKNTRCQCACGGEGQLLFIACPNCGHIALACDEVGTVFSDPHDLTKEPVLSWLDFYDFLCPSCHKEELKNYQVATWEQIQAVGFRPGEYE